MSAIVITKQERASTKGNRTLGVIHQPQPMRATAILVEGLVRNDLYTIFGYSAGRRSSHPLTSWPMQQRLRHVLTRHERGAVDMAQGYAKATGRVIPPGAGLKEMVLG